MRLWFSTKGAKPMNSRSERLLLSGAAGAIEAVRDGVEAPRGVAIIAHPHPLFGGTMDNKVVQTLARAFLEWGRGGPAFHFPGGGAREGGGGGELEDVLAVAEQVATHSAGQRIALAGFSFGASVASHALAALWPQGRGEPLVLVGLAARRCAAAPLPPEAHLRTLVVHGGHDHTVPLSAVLDWARPQVLPVTVIPAGGHFFHGQLPLLNSLVLRHLRSVAAPP